MRLSLRTDSYSELTLRSFGIATGLSYFVECWVEYEEPLAPKIDIRFKTSPESGQTVDEAFFNLHGNFVDVLSRLLESDVAGGEVIPVGYMPDLEKANERIGRNVRWFLLSHFRKVSLNYLAKEYHNQVHVGMICTKCDCRSTVRTGVKEAKRLLGLTSNTY